MKLPVLNGEFVKGVVYQTENVIVRNVQQGKERKRCYLIGNGHSLSISETHLVTKHDPGMHMFAPKIKAENAVYVFYFTFECSGLEGASKELATFIDCLSETYEEVILVGHSKCGLCLYQASHSCQENVTLVTISTPFHGTIIADKNAVERKLSLWLFKEIYRMVFSDHKVDRDLISNSRWFQIMQPTSCKKHINMTSSLERVSDCRNFVDLFLLALDRQLQMDGDGIVPLFSQQTNSTQTIALSCSHASSLEQGLAILEKEEL